MRMSKPVFYLLSCTWGIVHTLLGALVALVLVLMGHRPKKWGYCRYFELPRMRGGVSLGIFFVTHPRPSEHIRDHEHGHAIQNCLWGPIFPFLIAIPSFVRCQWRNVRRKLGIKRPQRPYDAIWFEGQASEWGRRQRLDKMR